MNRPQSLGRGYRWEVQGEDRETDEDFVAKLVQELKLAPVAARILARRGLDTVEAVQTFLNPDTTPLHNPLIMKDMMEAVTAIQRAAEARQRIRIYGDFDVDGTTATALLVDFLRDWGANVDYYIPHRVKDGYGLNSDAVREAAADGVGLVVTVDCGIAALEEAELAAELGLALVITDHHEAGPELPVAEAVVNPKQPNCPYPFKDLAGVGVAFKLAQAYALVNEGYLPETPELSEDFRELLSGYMELVTLGTVADVVPLREENRCFVSTGLRQLKTTESTGLRALKSVSRLDDKELTAGRISFGLAPRINAAGRMGHAGGAVQLLLTEDKREAQQLAERLNTANRERQQLEDRLVEELEQRLDAAPELQDSYFMIFAGEDWHRGVTGIAASRLVERYHRPTAVISVDSETGEGRASVRSISPYNVFGALQSVEELLLRYGGHAQAAGFGIEKARIPELRTELEQHARAQLSPEQLQGRARADSVVILPDIDERLVQELDRFAPCGVGNPRPTLMARELRVVEARKVGRNGEHLRLRVQDVIEGLTFGAIGFRLARGGVPQPGEHIDALFTPEFNEWNGKRRIQLRLRDVRRTRLVRRRKKRRQELQRVLQANWERMTRLHPGRQQLRELYVALRKVGSQQSLLKGGDELRTRLQEATGREFHPESIEAALTVFSELDLVHELQQGEDKMWVLSPAAEQRDLYESPRFVQGELAKESLRRFLRHSGGAEEAELEDIVSEVESSVS